MRLQCPRSHPFSPLFIGDVSATSAAIESASTCSRVLSVPSSSGKSLQRARRHISGTTAVLPFSPLFIGEVSATSCRRRPLTAIALSVPSSSGKSLQRHRHAPRRALGRTPFSPLFIGEVSATATPSRCGTGVLAPFSPLFIGEVSSTSCTTLSG